MTILTKIKLIVGIIIAGLLFVGGFLLSFFIQGKKDEEAEKHTDTNDTLIANQKPVIKEIIKKDKDNEKTDNDLNNKSVKLHNITK